MTDSTANAFLRDAASTGSVALFTIPTIGWVPSSPPVYNHPFPCGCVDVGWDNDPYETTQVPMFRMLGTPEKDKKHASFEGGHIPLTIQPVVKEILDWLDKYLGPVAPPH